MPEGPSIFILREEAERFAGRKVLNVNGNSKQDIDRMRGKKIVAVRSWGKHFLVEFDRFSMRIHFMLFGSYRINEAKDAVPRVSLCFSEGEQLNFYACSLRFIDEELDSVYDWSGDVMSPAWSPVKARRKLRETPNSFVADVLLDQDMFAGVGNIIKNEVLHRIRVHPETQVRALPPRKLTELITEARKYSFDFYTWKKAFVLKKNYQVHTKSVCPRDGQKLAYHKSLGVAKRRAFFCEKCQRNYSA